MRAVVGCAVPRLLTSGTFYWCRSDIWKLKCGAEVCSSQMNYVALGEEVGARTKGREGDSGIFSCFAWKFCLHAGAYLQDRVFGMRYSCDLPYFSFFFSFVFFSCLFSYHCMGAGRQKQGCMLSVQAEEVNKQPDRE